MHLISCKSREDFYESQSLSVLCDVRMTYLVSTARRHSARRRRGNSWRGEQTSRDLSRFKPAVLEVNIEWYKTALDALLPDRFHQVRPLHDKVYKRLV